jgi:arsenate reductase
MALDPEGGAMPRARVLFVCTGNSCRSQLAEAWARHLHGDRVEAHSAGLESMDLDPVGVEVMGELGIDISGHRCKLIEEFHGQHFDLVVTVCGHAEETCPEFPGARRLYEGFGNPARLAAGLEDPERVRGVYRRIRDRIRDFVTALPLELQERA